MVVVEYGNSAGIKMLLEAGTDFSIKDANGKTAYDIAEEENYTKCMELLKEAENADGAVLPNFFWQCILRTLYCNGSIYLC